MSATPQIKWCPSRGPKGCPMSHGHSLPGHRRGGPVWRVSGDHCHRMGRPGNPSKSVPSASANAPVGRKAARCAGPLGLPGEATVCGPATPAVGGSAGRLVCAER
jgi:hypothetical protein